MTSKKSEMTVGAIFDWYKRTFATNYRWKTWVENLRRYRLFCSEYGQLSVSDCRPSHVTKFVDSMPNVRSPAVRRAWNYTLQRPFNAAVDAQIIERNPARGAFWCQDHRDSTVADAEFRGLLHYASAAFRRVLIFLRYTGARPCEVRLIKAADVDPSGRAVSLHQLNCRWPSRMTRIVELQPNSVVHKLVLFLKSRSKPGEYLFRTRQNKQWVRKSLTRHLHLARKESGLPARARLFCPGSSNVTISEMS